MDQDVAGHPIPPGSKCSSCIILFIMLVTSLRYSNFTTLLPLVYSICIAQGQQNSVLVLILSGASHQPKQNQLDSINHCTGTLPDISPCVLRSQPTQNAAKDLLPLLQALPFLLEHLAHFRRVGGLRSGRRDLRVGESGDSERRQDLLEAVHHVALAALHDRVVREGLEGDLERNGLGALQ
jgi:hypothetical protein